MGVVHNNNSNTSLPPALKPVFGVALDDLLKRDGSAIPLVVYQCIQAIDLYGLDVEGIYRVSGSAAHVAKLKALFDHGELILTKDGLSKADLLQTLCKLISVIPRPSIMM